MCKMITVITLFQFGTDFIVCPPPFFSKFMKFRFQPGLNFLVTDPTDINKLIPHGDIVQVVQIAEHTDLAKLGNPRQQSELDATVHCLQHSIEGFQYAPIYFLKLLIADGLQHGLVIFVYQNGNPLPRLLVSTFYHAFETEGEGCLGRSGTVDSFPVGQKIIQHIAQILRCLIF